jgi:hypothetical protein
MTTPFDPRTPVRPITRSRWRSVSLAITAAAVLIGAACSSSEPSSAPATTVHHDAAPPSSVVPDAAEAAQLARARAATRYVTDLDAAKADGYRIITPMMPGMGYHFLNPAIQGFDVEKPPILVYLRNVGSWQLGALEWVFPEKPATPPLDGATYGTFGAACHYDDGTFVFAEAQASCTPASPDTGSAFVFWHPPLVTMHVWLWYPNPDGLFSGTNPLISPFNQPDHQLGSSHAGRLERWQTTHGA